MMVSVHLRKEESAATPSSSSSFSAANTSKELLPLEHRDSWSGSLLSICKVKGDGGGQASAGTAPHSFPLPSVGESSVLSRVKAFLPILGEANRKLTQAIKKKGAEEFNVEVVSETEKTSYVEMDVALGITELRTREAIEAAERLVGGQVLNTRPSKREGVEVEDDNEECSVDNVDDDDNWEDDNNDDGMDDNGDELDNDDNDNGDKDDKDANIIGHVADYQYRSNTSKGDSNSKDNDDQLTKRKKRPKIEFVQV